MSNRKSVIYIDKLIPAGESITFRHVVEDNGTIEKLNLKFYIGQEKDLQVVPRIVRVSREIEYLVTFNDDGNQYLSGDDDKMDLDIVVPCGINDVIEIKATNVDTTYDYHITCTITIDYFAGQNRVISGVV